MKITELEERVLFAFVNDDCVNDDGWQSKTAATQVKGFHRSCEMDGNTFSGVFSSLVKKGILWTNGESFGLTDLGRNTISPS